MINSRLILAILSTTLEETAMAIVVLIGLPEIGIHIPVVVLVLLMIAWAVIAIVIYRSGSRALQTKLTSGPEAMIGMKGEVVHPLDPEGFIKIGGELWRAMSPENNADIGEEVIIVKRKGMMLTVQTIDEQV